MKVKSVDRDEVNLLNNVPPVFMATTGNARTGWVAGSPADQGGTPSV